MFAKRQIECKHESKIRKSSTFHDKKAEVLCISFGESRELEDSELIQNDNVIWRAKGDSRTDSSELFQKN
jgi:hypothetical protein